MALTELQDEKSIEDIFKRAQSRGFRGFEKEANLEWLGPFCFIQAADPQFGLIDEMRNVNIYGPVEEAIRQSQEYKARAASVWDEEIRLSSLAVEQWNQIIPRPKFAVICGDLVNDFPFGHQRSDQLVDFRKVFRRISSEIPLVLLPGNHDVADRPTPESIENYRSNFGDDYFSFWVGGVLFIVLNVQYYKNSSGAEALAQEHDRWIDERLEEVKSGSYKHVIVFQHIPWFLKEINEPDDAIFNITLSERKRMIQKFSNAGVRAIFAGHYHRNAGGHFEDLELVVTSAMGAIIKDMDTGILGKSGYRIVDVQEDRLDHRFVEIESGGGS